MFRRKKRNVTVTTSDTATQTSAVWEDDAEKDKKIAEQQKQLESKEKQIAELQATLKLKDDFYTRQEAHLQGMMEQERIIQEAISNITTGASSSGNNADMEKEQMKRKIGTLKMILLSKDRVIRWQKQVIQEVREHHGRSQEAAEEMKVTIGALENLLKEKDRRNGTQDGETKNQKDAGIFSPKEQRESGNLLGFEESYE